MCTDVYNYADSFGGQDPIASDLIRPMLNRMHALAPGKPVMLGEFGIEYVPTALDDASRRTAWYQDLFTFANNNEIKLIAQFNFESNAVFGQVGVPNLDGYAQLLRNASWFLTANPSNPRLVDDSTFAGVSLPLISFSSPAPTGTPSSLSSSSSALSIGVIIGIAVGGGVGLILFIALLLYSKRHSSKLSYESERASENSSSVRSHENRPFRGIVNPELNSGFC